MKTVRILGAFNRNSDWRLEGADHWALNNFHNVVDDETEIHSWFQMHSRDQWERGRNGELHKEWLKKKHPFPIYMQQKYKGVPSAKKYPKDEADPLWPFSWWGPIYSDTFCYMIALAMLQGYERIDLFNVYLVNPIEAYLEAPGVSLWMAIASRVAEVTGNGRLFRSFRYGYEPRVAPLWLPREVAALTVIDELPDVKQYFKQWDDARYQSYK